LPWQGCRFYGLFLLVVKTFALISLIGLPGSGKSTVGRQLARRLQLPFVDSDHAIEARLGCPIREFFEREGEARFREIESEVIDQLSAQGAGVLATGGGAVRAP
jgi:shikimate kinase